MNKDILIDNDLINHIRDVEELERNNIILNSSRDILNRHESCHPISYNLFKNTRIWHSTSSDKVSYDIESDIHTFHRDSGADYLIRFNTLELDPNTSYKLYFNVLENSMTADFRSISSSSFLIGNFIIPAGETGEFSATFNTGSSETLYDLWLYCNSSGTLKANIMLLKGNTLKSYVPYEGCLYGLELYNTIESNFITDNYYLNCGVIALFLTLIILIVNAPFLFIRKIRGN